MADTQLPRFVVFEQKRSNEPHTHAGSVHAADAEMALMNARDVFVRRPACVSLWVAPAYRIYSKTAQELESESRIADELTPEGPAESYLVFRKMGSKGVLTYVGRIDASSAPQAMKAAVKLHEATDVKIWWVLPERYVAKTDPGESESLFEPAELKPFRHQSDFRTFTLMRRILKQVEDHQQNED